MLLLCARVWLLLSAAGCCTQQAVEYSSRLSAPQRAANLRAFAAGDAQVLVCSDAMTRGMDVPDVANVINYDAPVYVKTYVHRAGRTARAGRSGQVVTLLRDKVRMLEVLGFERLYKSACRVFLVSLCIFDDSGKLVHKRGLEVNYVVDFQMHIIRRMSSISKTCCARQTTTTCSSGRCPERRWTSCEGLSMQLCRQCRCGGQEMVFSARCMHCLIQDALQGG